MLSIDQVQQLLSIIDKNHLIFIAKNLGDSFLSKEDKLLLRKFKVPPTKVYRLSSDKLATSFHLGLLADSLKIFNLKTLKFDDLKKYIESGKYISLTQRELAVLDSIKRQVYTSIKSLQGKIFKDINQILVDKTREGQEKFLRDETYKGIEDKKTVKEIVAEIARKTGDYNRDFDRIVQYCCTDAYEAGKAEMLLREGQDTKCYKLVFEKSCKHCKRLFQNPDNSPKIFKISELLLNGSNIGRKTDEWKSVVGPVHPFCRCQLQKVPIGLKYNPKTNKFDLRDDTWKPRVIRDKIKVKIGGKEYMV